MSVVHLPILLSGFSKGEFKYLEESTLFVWRFVNLTAQAKFSLRAEKLMIVHLNPCCHLDSMQNQHRKRQTEWCDGLRLIMIFSNRCVFVRLRALRWDWRLFSHRTHVKYKCMAPHEPFRCWAFVKLTSPHIICPSSSLRHLLNRFFFVWREPHFLCLVYFGLILTMI